MPLVERENAAIYHYLGKLTPFISAHVNARLNWTRQPYGFTSAISRNSPIWTLIDHIHPRFNAQGLLLGLHTWAQVACLVAKGYDSAKWNCDFHFTKLLAHTHLAFFWFPRSSIWGNNYIIHEHPTGPIKTFQVTQKYYTSWCTVMSALFIYYLQNFLLTPLF